MLGVSVGLVALSVALVVAAAGYDAAATAAAGVVRELPRTALDRVSSAIAGKRVVVRCGDPRQWNGFGERVLGYAIVGGDVSTLAPAVCARLRAMQHGARPADLLMSAAALVTVAHEAEHLHGIANEAVAECYGIQRAATVASALHIVSAYAARALAVYWADYALRPSAYRSVDCYDGGPLDLAPSTAGWP